MIPRSKNIHLTLAFSSHVFVWTPFGLQVRGLTLATNDVKCGSHFLFLLDEPCTRNAKEEIR